MTESTGFPRFELYTGKNGEFYFRLRSKGNGENILGSEGYTAKSGAQNGIESVKKNSQEDSRFERKESANGKWYFVLKAANSQVIGQSQMYASKSGMEGGIKAVMRDAPDAPVVEV